MSISLDTARNELYLANAIITLVSCGFAFAGYFGGLFGLNLSNVNDIMDAPGSFVEVTVMSVVAGLLTLILGYGYMRVTGILPESTHFF
jgi:hypothetical protein